MVATKPEVGSVGYIGAKRVNFTINRCEFGMVCR